jgi:DNA polymerase-3 subunit epsilon
VASDFVEYVRDAELIIHNAPFDVGFLDHELCKLPAITLHIAELCSVTDTLVMAKKMHPGQRNSLDALCKRYDIDNSHRELHGALLDAEILADVYLMLTGGQASLQLGGADLETGGAQLAGGIRRVAIKRGTLTVVRATPQELQAHESRLKAMGNNCVWRGSNKRQDLK